jgi:hypothetical protein
LVSLLEIDNIGPTSTSARDFSLVLVSPSRTIGAMAGSADAMFRTWFGDSPNDTNLVLLSEEFLQRRTTAKTIIPGESVRGWLIFEGVESINSATGAAINYYDTVLQQNRSVSVETVTLIPPVPPPDLVFRYPDITYPFLANSTIDRIQKLRLDKQTD